MTGRPTKRGDVIQVLNRLLEENRIAGFSTNLFEKAPPVRPLVRVFSRMRDEPQAVEQEVRQALAAIDASVDVQVDPLADLKE